MTIVAVGLFVLICVAVVLCGCSVARTRSLEVQADGSYVDRKMLAVGFVANTTSGFNSRWDQRTSGSAETVVDEMGWRRAVDVSPAERMAEQVMGALIQGLKAYAARNPAAIDNCPILDNGG